MVILKYLYASKRNMFSKFYKVSCEYICKLLWNETRINVYITSGQLVFFSAQRTHPQDTFKNICVVQLHFHWQETQGHRDQLAVNIPFFSCYTQSIISQEMYLFQQMYTLNFSFCHMKYSSRKSDMI